MLRVRTGTAGSAAGAAAAARYFLGETLRPENEVLAAYYAGQSLSQAQTPMDDLIRSVIAGERPFSEALDHLVASHDWPSGIVPPDIVGDVARAVVRGSLAFDDGIACLMAAWEDRNPEPNTAAWQAAAERLMVWQDNHWVWRGPDPLEDWDHRRSDAEARAYTRLDGAVERIEKLLTIHLEQTIERAEKAQTLAAEGGSVARVREDLNPALAGRLGIDTSRGLAQSEIAHLLAGARADGQPIEGKQIQKPMRSVAEVFALDIASLPAPEVIDHVLAGRRADGEPPRSAQGNGEPLPDKVIDGARRRFLAAYGLPAGTDLTPEHIDHLHSGKSATGRFLDSGDVLRHLTATKQPISYTDMIWSADKTVSVAWALAPTEAERAIILQAHRDAVASTMAYVESHLGFARKGDAGRDGTEPGATAWVACDHYTARPTAEIAMTDASGEAYTEFQTVPLRDPDPLIHTHTLLLNAVLTESGRIGAMDLDRLDGRVKEFGAVYQAYMARNLRAGGIDAQHDPETGAARIMAVGPEAARHFSKRTLDIERAAHRYAADEGLDWSAMTPAHQLKLLRRGVEETRQRKQEHDGDSDFAMWRKQADEIGYHHRSVLRPGEEQALRPEAERHRQAYEVSLPLIEQALAQRARLDANEFREFATRGLIAAGISDDPGRDIKAVMGLYRVHGVRQNGQMTPIAFGKDVPVRGKERWAVTTAMHEAEEQTVVRLARAYGDDLSGALSSPALERASQAFLAAHPEIKPNDPQWIKQREAIERAGAGAMFTVVEGVAGAGKSTLLSPVVAAYREAGQTVYGIARGWKQANSLQGAGLTQKDVAATSVFFDRVSKGKVTLNKNSTVIVEELSQIGRGEMLKLMKLQQAYGFRMLAIGDSKQGGAIDPEVIDLLNKTLGDKVPKILTSIRQNTERERAIAGLFRAGKAETAIAMKIEDQTAELVAGGRGATIQRIAAKWHELTQADPTLQPTIGTATNRDAHDIGVAVRERLQAAGMVGPDRFSLNVLRRGEAGVQPMPLADGDRVRVFHRIWIEGRHFASNGDTLAVVNVGPKGMTARNDAQHEAFIAWDKLQGRFDPAPSLAYGHALTIDASQGTTSRVHFDAILGGSWQQQGGKGYVNESRHIEATYLIVNEAAERKQIYSRIPKGEYRPIRSADIWEHVAANLSRPTTKSSALAFIKRASELQRGGLAAFPAALEPAERRERAGEPRTTLGQRLERSTAGRQIAAEQRQATIERARERTPVQRANEIARANRPAPAPQRRPEIVTHDRERTR